MDNRNATASWSGYLHQGKIGILIALIEIEKILSENSNFKNFKIEYESAEDIDLKDGKNVISRHQVKAYKDAKYPNDYKDVLGVLKYNETGKKILTKGFNIEGCDKKPKFLHVIEEVKGFYLSKEEFKKEYPNCNYVDNPNNIKLYEYPDGKKFCELSSKGKSKLDNFCIEKIKEILILVNHNFKNNEYQQKNIFLKLLGLLDSEIRKRHMEGKNSYPILELKNLSDEIKNIKEYQLDNIQTIRKLFSECWVEFLLERDMCKIKTNNLKKLEIEEIVKKIYNLEDDKFIEFIKNINPSERMDKNCVDNEDIGRLCQIDKVKDIFYECLLNIEKCKFIVEEFGYKEEGGYWLTLINRPESIIKSVVDSIIGNKEISPKVFDNKYLINGQIDNVNLFDYFKEDEEGINNSWKRKLEVEDKFFNLNLKFISKEKAIDKLNKR